MSNFTNQQIENTLSIINSLIINCEKIQPKLLKSAAQITSIINKSKSGISHAKEGSGTYTRFRKIIDSMTIALSYVEAAIKES